MSFEKPPPTLLLQREAGWNSKLRTGWVVSVLRGYGITAADPKGLGGDLDARSGLPTLVLVAGDQAHNLAYGVGIEALGDDLLHRVALLHPRFDDPVEDLIGRQRVLIFLVGTQLGRRRFGESRLRDDLAVGV